MGGNPHKLGQDKQLFILWDGATYHKYSAMRAYVEEINKGLEPKDWKITCELFAPNAPEQNRLENKRQNIYNMPSLQSKTGKAQTTEGM